MNPFSDKPGPQPEAPVESLPAGEPISGSTLTPAAPRDPVWTGWDVLLFFILSCVLILGTLLAIVLVAPGETLRARGNYLSRFPELSIAGQMLDYVVLFGCMYILVRKERNGPGFWKAIHWNFPRRVWPYLTIGLALQIVLLGMERFLPLPKETPFDTLLRRPSTVVLIAVFAITLGPLMEELFFRGLLYASLARRFGVSVGITFSAFGFGLLHAAQYGYSWASVLLIFLVGVVLGIVRALKDSVAAGFLVHAAYNGTIILMIVIASGGLRHLERLSGR